MILQTFLLEIKQMIGGSVTKGKNIPWWKLHIIAKNLNGELKTYTIQDSRGNVCKQIVIEYKEEQE